MPHPKRDQGSREERRELHTINLLGKGFAPQYRSSTAPVPECEGEIWAGSNAGQEFDVATGSGRCISGNGAVAERQSRVGALCTTSQKSSRLQLMTQIVVDVTV